MAELDCKVCGAKLRSFRSLSKHIRDIHEISPQDYYETHIGKGCCVICNSPVKFINLNMGFNKTCSHICGGKYHRKNLKSDKDRHDKFVERVRINSNKFHSNMTPEDKIRLSNKISDSSKRVRSSMSFDERVARYGWLNKLEGEARASAISRIVSTGMHKWWREATEEQKQEVYVKRFDAITKSIINKKPFNPDTFVVEPEVFNAISNFFETWQEKNFQAVFSDQETLRNMLETLKQSNGDLPGN